MTLDLAIVPEIYTQNIGNTRKNKLGFIKLKTFVLNRIRDGGGGRGVGLVSNFSQRQINCR